MGPDRLASYVRPCPFRMLGSSWQFVARLALEQDHSFGNGDNRTTQQGSDKQVACMSISTQSATSAPLKTENGWA